MTEDTLIKKMNAEIAALDAERASLRAGLAAAHRVHDAVLQALAAVRAAERERCAKVCDDAEEDACLNGYEIRAESAANCAAEIRALTDD